MDRDFYTDEFEQFLKSKADQHRLYPSEMVWKKINRTLHPTKSGLIVAALFLLFLFTGDQILRVQTDTNELSGSIIKNDEIAANDFLQQIRAGLNLTQNRNTVHIFNQPIYSNNINIYKWLNGYNYVANSALPKVIADKLPIAQRITSSFSTRFSDLPPLNAIAASYVAIPENEVGKVFINDNTETRVAMNASVVKLIANNKPVAPAVAAKPIIAVEPKKSSPAITTPVVSYASVKIPKISEPKHLQLQYYFAPTISFRKLEDPSSKSTSSQDLPLASNHLDVNKFVNHSPTIGLEAGSALLFPVTKNISIKAGLQLNMNGYNVSAYTYSREKATIALTTPGNINDTIRAFTSIRNMNGYSQEILQNRYFQLSMPVGIDVKIIGDHRLQLNAAGTFQPFYVMAHSTYLLSNDYNNYVKEHSLVRRFNYAANLETYVSYTGANGLKFQLGPQFRYQLKSTYSDRYPIHEYLMEYSIKFGIIKTLR
ncbi:hypothetical protein QEG73_20950 [Chitinophagaceae bacterium 26-R-25]|nr:hypothetical protein [Chitinophagaceae bacterium 26-R-25]